MKRILTVGMTRHCNICEKKTLFSFNGTIDFPRFTVRQWDCQECGGTQADKVQSHQPDAADFTEIEQEYARMGYGATMTERQQRVFDWILFSEGLDAAYAFLDAAGENW